MLDLMQSTNGRYSFGMSISQEPCRIGSWESSSNFMDVFMVYQYKEVGRINCARNQIRTRIYNEWLL